MCSRFGIIRRNCGLRDSGSLYSLGRFGGISQFFAPVTSIAGDFYGSKRRLITCRRRCVL